MGRIKADSREQYDWVAKGADEVGLNEYRGESGEVFSYDFHLWLEDESEARVERKSFEDFVKSFTSGELDRQVAAVDLLIVEQPSLLDEVDEQHEKNAIAHLELLKLLVPVIESQHLGDTMRILRRIADRPGGLKIRPNHVGIKSATLKEKFLACIPSVNVFTQVDGPVTKADLLSVGMEWAWLAEALDHAFEYYNENKPNDQRRIGIGVRRRVWHALTGEAPPEL